MLNPDYKEMLSALSNAGADFIVVGAFALAAHGNPRSTGDIDILVRPTKVNAEKTMRALASFGAPLDQITESDFVDPETVFQIGVEPRRIDLLTALEGIENFDEAWQTHIVAQIDDFSIPVLGRDVLIKNKKALGRPQDLADVAWLEENSP